MALIDADDKKNILARAAEIVDEQYKKGERLVGPQAAIAFLRYKMTLNKSEAMYGLFLDADMRVASHHELFKGTLTQTAVHPREIIKCAIAANAAFVVIAHSHPTGDPFPSLPDVVTTHRLVRTLKAIDVDLLDHVVIAQGGTFSMASHGLLDEGEGGLAAHIFDMARQQKIEMRLDSLREELGLNE